MTFSNCIRETEAADGNPLGGDVSKLIGHQKSKCNPQSNRENRKEDAKGQCGCELIEMMFSSDGVSFVY